MLSIFNEAICHTFINEKIHVSKKCMRMSIKSIFIVNKSFMSSEFFSGISYNYKIFYYYCQHFIISL